MAVTEDNRRLYPRRRVTFPATFTLDGHTRHPAFGLDLSGGGVQLFTRDKIEGATKSLSLVAVLSGRHVAMRTTRCWSSTIEAPSGKRYKHGLKLQRIDDADWEFLMNLTLEGDGQGLLGGVLTPGQLGRMMSPQKQHWVAETLAAAGRLTYNAGNALPLIEYTFDGYTMRQGVPYYRFSVRSKIQKADGPQECRSRVLVAIEGETVRLID